jgi:hypothetical protein
MRAGVLLVGRQVEMKTNSVGRVSIAPCPAEGILGVDADWTLDTTIEET